MKQDKIDIVYLWVDPTDENWRAEKDKWFEKINGKKPIYHGAAGDERFRDNGELLYSFRSVAECAPWVNHIYLITGFGHVPKWLNTNHPKITIVPHEQIMPKNALPTFNSIAIEMCIPNIPGLSEHFILMNDDMFFNKKLSPSFFFDARGRALFRYSKNSYDDGIPFAQWKSTLDGYTQTLALSAKYIDDMFGKKMYNMRPSHGIDPYIKSSWIECIKTPGIREQVENQIFNKFRTNDEIQRWTFNLYDLMMGRAKFIKARGYKSGHHKISNFIYNTLHYFAVRKSPVFCFDAYESAESIEHAAVFCINDSSESTDLTRKHNSDFLDKRFPYKCEFEI